MFHRADQIPFAAILKAGSIDRYNVFQIPINHSTESMRAAAPPWSCITSRL
ncbi:MAG: hypothetical protein R3C03_15310 [Pirellulaceae bacterium]